MPPNNDRGLGDTGELFIELARDIELVHVYLYMYTWLNLLRNKQTKKFIAQSAHAHYSLNHLRSLLFNFCKNLPIIQEIIHE